MKIKVNGEPVVLNEHMSLSEVIEMYLSKKEPSGIAVAKNDKIVPRQKWESETIAENDNVEIVHAVQGG